jgi:hypothetical protein
MRHAWVVLLLIGCDEAKKIAEDPDVKKAVAAVEKGADAAMLELNETKAKSAMRDILAAEQDFRNKDLDKDGKENYWTGDVAGLQAVGALSDSIAAADSKNTKGAAHFGYRFKMMERTRDGKAYAEDLDGKGAKTKNRWVFAVCAVPQTYKQTGVVTLILSNDGVIYKKDTGGKPVLKWPSEKEILDEWKEVDRIKG